VSTLAYLALVDPVSAALIWFFAGVAAMVANVATLSLAAAVCPPRAEGFTFAALMSVMNLATPLSDTIGSVLYEHVFARRLSTLIVISAALTAAVLLLVPFVNIRRGGEPV